MLHTLQASDFSSLLHQKMPLYFVAEQSLPAELMEVRELPRAFTPLERTPFAIVVRTSQTTHYYQQTMAVLHHPEKGELPIFFVPVGFDGVGVLYEAVFS